MPVIRACPIILSSISLYISREGRRKKATITGRLARPSRRNGSGFGIAYSTAARNRHRAARKGRSFLSVVCVTLSPFYCHYYPVGQTCQKIPVLAGLTHVYAYLVAARALHKLDAAVVDNQMSFIQHPLELKLSWLIQRIDVLHILHLYHSLGCPLIVP